MFSPPLTTTGGVPQGPPQPHPSKEVEGASLREPEVDHDAVVGAAGEGGDRLVGRPDHLHLDLVQDGEALRQGRGVSRHHVVGDDQQGPLGPFEERLDVLEGGVDPGPGEGQLTASRAPASRPR